MKALLSSIAVIFKRPLVFVYIAIITLIFCLIEYYNPVTGVISGLSKLGGGNVFDSFFVIINILIKPLSYPKMLLYLGGVIVILSIFAGLILSGYLFAVNNTVEKRKRTRGELRFGFKKYFFRVFFLSLFAMVVGVLFVSAVLVALVPAMYLTKSALAGTFIIQGYSIVLIDILTVVIVLFAILIFEVYFTFLFPSVYSGEKRPYNYGNKVAGRAFFHMIIPFIIFDALLIAFQIFLSYFEASLFLLAVNWIFKSFYVSIFISYIFASYKNYRITDKNE